MKMKDKRNNVPYGYNPSNEIPPEEPDVEPDREDILSKQRKSGNGRDAQSHARIIHV